jgi:hypothetical protein
MQRQTGGANNYLSAFAELASVRRTNEYTLASIVTNGRALMCASHLYRSK